MATHPPKANQEAEDPNQTQRAETNTNETPIDVDSNQTTEQNDDHDPTADISEAQMRAAMGFTSFGGPPPPPSSSHPSGKKRKYDRRFDAVVAGDEALSAEGESVLQRGGRGAPMQLAARGVVHPLPARPEFGLGSGSRPRAGAAEGATGAGNGGEEAEEERDAYFMPSFIEDPWAELSAAGAQSGDSGGESVSV